MEGILTQLATVAWSLIQWSKKFLLVFEVVCSPVHCSNANKLVCVGFCRLVKAKKRDGQ